MGKSKKEKKEQTDSDFTIKPQSVTPVLDTSQWPLLLKVSFLK